MKPLDKKYVSLQFWLKVHQNSGIEFQSFFEQIMERAYPDFQKIRPYGREGDKGNDGYRPSQGIYYQAYAPSDPSEKEAEAAEKFKDDFEKLKNGWDKISTIKELDFVYNEKGSGLTVKLEGAKAALKNANPQIDFKIFTPKDLEVVFLSLSSDAIAALGLDIDSRNAVQSARDQLTRLDEELDKESGEFVLRVLGTIDEIIAGQRDEGLSLEYEILEARALQKMEKVQEAREKFESIVRRYPADPRAFLHLAEIHINVDDFERNAEFLREAEGLAPEFALLRLQKLIREIRLGTLVDPSTIDVSTFPSEPRPRANLYRLYASMLQRAGDNKRAVAFVERALHINPDKFHSHDAKIALLEDELRAEEDHGKRKAMATSVLKAIDDVGAKFNEGGGLTARCQSLLNVRRLHVHLVTENYAALETTARETLDLVLTCYFDQLIDGITADTIHWVGLSATDFGRLQRYFKAAAKPLSDALAKILILQFLHKETLFTEGKAFFVDVRRENIVELISAIEGNNFAFVLAFVGKDVQFAVDLALGLSEPAELKRKLVESLPDDGSVNKDKLALMLYYDAGELDNAFAVVRKLDLSTLSYIECLSILRIAYKQKAWDSAVVLLEKILAHEQDPQSALQATLQLFTANFHLQRYAEVIRIGRSVLENPSAVELLDDYNKETLVGHTALAYMTRGELGAKEFVQAHELQIRSFEAKIGVQAEVYVKSGEPVAALRSVVEGIKILQHPTPEQYGRLFLIFGEIGNLMPEFTLDSAERVAPGLFVKLHELERWFYIGTGEELDATKVADGDPYYPLLMGKAQGDKVSLASRYRATSPEYVIEAVYPIEKYILWQARYHAFKLSAEQRWDAIELIEVPTTDGSIDPQYLIARLEYDEKRRGEFFKLYCEQDVPLALLALNEGGLAGAIGHIASAQKGFIKATSGSAEEFEQQKGVARRITAGEAFYLDGTSALMLSETGSFQKVYGLIPGLRVPQSVVSLLFELRDKFAYHPGQSGHLAYVNGNIVFSELDREKGDAIKANFATAVTLLESRPDSIVAISAANKANNFMEQRVAASVSDACILAQRDGVAVLTEDFLYLRANEIETKKAAPAYCSSLALFRVLYEEGKVSFEEYLDYVAYLTAYRVRFLPLTTDDLEKAVFGDQIIKVVRPEQLRKFNFALTLSEEYGVPPPAAFNVVGTFWFRVLVDDSISPEIATRIFIEIVTTFPTKKSRKVFGQTLMFLTVQAINASRRSLVVGSTKQVQAKVDAVAEFLRTYGPDELIIVS
ncbi:MAG TPA: hypothetical protein VLC46_21855 [Thermoanaerobaculia bacterium]|jgi:tetratricopeptide (TPR) repeat protein|nr:hypothetical protein [Thermoanaerobaculia bacterium]